MNETIEPKSDLDKVELEGVKDPDVRKTGSKILDEIVRKVNLQRDTIANWAQNWSVHTNHTNNSGD
jgi:hypothetical protein